MIHVPVNHCDRRITILSDISFALFTLLTYFDMSFVWLVSNTRNVKEILNIIIVNGTQDISKSPR